jgi:hypothetical protein
VGGEQRYRLVPLIFSALTVLAAYLLVRSLPWWRSDLASHDVDRDTVPDRFPAAARNRSRRRT